MVVFAESEPAIQHDVPVGVQWVRVNQDRGVGGSGELLGADSDLRAVPFQRELVDDPGEDFVASGISPKNQVAVRYVGFGDGCVIPDLRFTAKLTAPFFDRPRLLVLHPFGDSGRSRLSGWLDENEAVHKGVID